MKVVTFMHGLLPCQQVTADATCQPANCTSSAVPSCQGYHGLLCKICQQPLQLLVHPSCTSSSSCTPMSMVKFYAPPAIHAMAAATSCTAYVALCITEVIITVLPPPLPPLLSPFQLPCSPVPRARSLAQPESSTHATTAAPAHTQHTVWG